MAITLSPDTTRQLKVSLKRYFAEHLEQDIGDLKADMLLDYCLKEIGPVINLDTLDAAKATAAFLKIEME